MKNIKEKKGEITTQQIVILIILITSFIVILFLLFRLNLGGETDKELCRNSVVLKGNSALSGISNAPLNCKRTYKCVTSDGTCEGLTNPEIIKANSLNEVYKNLAEEMTDCWWMFGEGKIDYVGKELTKDNLCSICSQVLLDDSLKDMEGIKDAIEVTEEGKKVKASGINKDDFYENYLAKKQMPGKEITYAEYLFGTKDLKKFKEEIKTVTEKQETSFFERVFGSKTSGKKVNPTFGTMEIGNQENPKQYLIVMGETSRVNTAGWIALGVGIGVAAIVLAPVGIIGGAIIFGGATTGGLALGEVADVLDVEIGAIVVKGKGAVKNDFMAPTIVEAKSEEFEKLNCNDIATFN
jgi:hypothetical protein